MKFNRDKDDEHLVGVHVGFNRLEVEGHEGLQYWLEHCSSQGGQLHNISLGQEPFIAKTMIPPDDDIQQNVK